VHFFQRRDESRAKAAKHGEIPMKRNGCHSVRVAVLATIFAVSCCPGAVGQTTRGKPKASPTPAQTGGGQDKLKLLDHPVIPVDPVCNAEGQGSATLSIRNDGTSTVVLNPVQISATDLTTSSAPAKTLNVRPVLGKPDKIELAPHGITTMEASVTKVFEDGDWVSSIENDGTELGKLRIVRSGPSFAIALDSPTPASPELTFEKGQQGHFWLKNSDPIDYAISWDYSINGISVACDRAQAPVAQSPGSPYWFCRFFCSPRNTTSCTTGPLVTIPAKGQQEIRFDLPDQWFRQVSVLKDQTANGYLTVRLPATEATAAGKSGCAATATKTFSVKTHLVHKPGLWSEVCGDLEILLVLAIGAIISVLLNLMLPNQMRKIRIKDQLGKLGAQIAGLSYDLASRLRVLVGLEQRLIRDRVRNLSWVDSEFSTEMQSIAQAIDHLRTRLQFLTTLGTARTNFKAKCFDLLPPTLMFELEALFDEVVSIGEKADPSDEDVKAAQALIKTIEDRVDAGILNNSDFTTDLQNRATQLKADFDPTNGRIGSTPTCRRIAGLLPRPFALVLATDPTSLTAATNKLAVESQIDLDLALFQLDVIGEYVDLVDGMPGADPLTKKRLSHEAELIHLLERRSTEALHRAHLLIGELNNGYFQDDIEDAIKNKNFALKLSPSEVRQFEPCDFKLTLLSSDLDGAAAREEWNCTWQFTPPSRTVLVSGTPKQEPTEAVLYEDGWEVTHYFQQAAAYQVQITLTRTADGLKLPIPQNESFTGEIKVLPERRRRFKKVLKYFLSFRLREAYREWSKGKLGATWVLEFFRLAMALSVALLGLLGGAKDQLLKLDIVPAFIAIFLIGFSADQVKNLLTQRLPGPELGTQK
jgi:hypothetical protein